LRAYILIAVLWCAGLASAQFRTPVLTETPVRVSNHVQEILGFPNIIFVTGEQATLVIDTGMGQTNGATVTRVARTLAQGKGQKLYLTTTHFHPEHVAGEGGFPQGTVLIRATVQQQELAEHGMEMVTRFGMNPQWSDLLKTVTKLRQPDITFDHELTIDLGGVTARLLYFGGGHTRGDELIFVEPDSVLVSGDLVQNRVVPSLLGEGASSTSWLEVLDKIEPLHPKIVVPTHSQIGDGSLIAKERDFIVDMRTRTLALKEKGVAVEEAAKQITEQFKTAYPDWASSTDWPNLTSVPAFVRRIYAEEK
jgi:glyoxylase-like metal-dependent hydrolase (beta-lactamase superfamily II)